MRKALKRAIAYGIYYIIFIGVTIYGTIRGWPLRIPILLVFLILLYACVGGKSNAITEYRYHTDNPMIAPDLPIQPERSSASVSFLASFLLLLPPGLYLIISVCIGLLTQLMAEPLCSILVVDTPHPRYENATSDTAVYSVDVLSPASGSAVRALSLVQTAGAPPKWAARLFTL